MDPDDVSRGALQQSTLPFHLGGLGLASAVRSRDGAYWASWADAVSTIHKKDPDLAATILAGLHSEGEGCFAVANQCAERLVALGVELPTWDAVVAGATPRPSRLAAARLQHSREGVQHRGSVAISGDERESFDAVSERSSGRGPIAIGMDSEIFRTLLLRRLRLPLPLNHAFADVAVSLTALAITSLRVLSQVLWSGEVSRWRLLWHASLERVEQGSRPT